MQAFSTQTQAIVYDNRILLLRILPHLRKQLLLLTLADALQLTLSLRTVPTRVGELEFGCGERKHLHCLINGN